MATPFEAKLFGRNFVWFGSGFQITQSLDLTAARTLKLRDQRLVRLDASSAAFTVTLPAGPAPGDTFTFKEAAGSANPVTISGNGKLIEGAASLILNVPWRCRVLRFSDTGNRWELIGGVG